MKFVVIATLMFLLAGCAFHVPRYTADPKNTEIISGSVDHVGLKIIDPKFEDNGSIACRAAGAVTLSEKSTFSQYIANALIAELEAVKAYEKKSTNVLEFELVRADFTSALGNTNWYIDSKYIIKEKEFTVSTIYHDRSSYVATKACNNVAEYFSKAVSKHISEVFNQASFRQALNMNESKMPNNSDITARIKKLDGLLKQGLISAEEYDTQKARILESI